MGLRTNLGKSAYMKSPEGNLGRNALTGPTYKSLISRWSRTFRYMRR